MSLPNFLVIGATRSGTTSLHYYLQQHPQVFLSPLKSTNFFLYLAEPGLLSDPGTEDPRQRFPVRSLADYESLFRGVRGQSAVGEVSPEYLAREGVTRKIEQHLPGVRVIAILRNPIDRAFAAYTMRASYGQEGQTFENILEEESRRQPDARQRRYLRGGFYALHLKSYFERFGRERVAVLLHDDLSTDCPGLLRRTFQFLDVNDNVEVDTSLRFNSWGRPASRWGRIWQQLTRKRRVVQALQRQLPPSVTAAGARWLARRSTRRMARPQISSGAREQLCAIYCDDIRELETMIDRDLSHWLRPRQPRHNATEIDRRP